MIRYFFDFEFNGYGGDLISLAVVRENGEFIYLITDQPMDYDPWVAENVVPHLLSCPATPYYLPPSEWGEKVSKFIYRGDEVPQLFADWMSDIADLMKVLITGPGEAVPMSHQTHLVCLRHLDVYPTSLKDAVQHNAWWDAMALRRWLEEMETK